MIAWRWCFGIFLFLGLWAQHPRFAVRAPLQVAPSESIPIWGEHGRNVPSASLVKKCRIQIWREKASGEASLAFRLFQVRWDPFWMGTGPGNPPWQAFGQQVSRLLLPSDPSPAVRELIAQLLSKQTPKEGVEAHGPDHLRFVNFRTKEVPWESHFERVREVEGLVPGFQNPPAYAPSQAFNLQSLPPGFYFLDLAWEDQRATLPCLVSPLRLHIQAIGKMIQVQLREGLQPVSEASIWIRNGKGRQQELRTDGEGLARLDLAFQPTKIWAQRGEAFAYASLNHWPDIPSEPTRLFAHTDRPIYRPGQEVHLRVIFQKSPIDWARDTVSPFWVLNPDGRLEEEEDPKQLDPQRRGLRFEMQDPSGRSSNPLRGTAVLLDQKTGTFAGSFTLPESCPPGQYFVQIQAGNHRIDCPIEVRHFEKPRFQVQLEALESPKEGEDLAFRVRATALHGGPVPRRPVEWTLFQIRGDQVDSRRGDSGETDAEGRFNFQIPRQQVDPKQSYRLLVKVMDAGGQQQKAVRAIGAESSDQARLRLQISSAFYRAGEKVEVRAQVLNEQGKARLHPVKLKLCRATAPREEAWTLSNWGLGDPVEERMGPQASFRLQPGVYWIVAEAKGPGGEALRAQEALLVYTPEENPFPASPFLRALADRPQYQALERAKVLLFWPRGAKALFWSLHGEHGEEAHGRLEPQGKALSTLEFRVPKTFQPNGHLNLEIHGEGGIQSLALPMATSSEAKRLPIQLKASASSYRPGQKARVEIRVPEEAGLGLAVADEALHLLAPTPLADPLKALDPPRSNPVRIAVTGQGLVADWLESRILVSERTERRPISEPPPIGDPLPVRLYYSPEHVYPSLEENRGRNYRSMAATVEVVAQAAPDSFILDGSNVSSRAMDQAFQDLREHFLDTALWIPHQRVQGRTQLEIPLPDDLTTWRLTAVGVTAQGRAGLATTSLPVKKALQLNLILPRHLVQGDESRAVALVQNRSARALEGQVEVRIQGGRVLEAPRGRFKLKSGEERRLAFRITADEGSERLKIQAAAVAGSLRDGESREIPLSPATAPMRIAGHHRLRGNRQRIELELPADWEQPAQLSLLGVSGHLEQLVAPSLNYLIRYPYGCVEQTLSSFYPNLLVAELVKRGLYRFPDNPKAAPNGAKDLENNIQKGVERVYAYQQEHGGWGWYGPSDFGGRANPHTTGFALLALASMERLGYDVDRDRLQRACSAAQNLLNETMEIQPEQAAFLLRCLALTGQELKEPLRKASEAVLKGNWKDSALLAQVALAAVIQEHPSASALLDRLEAQVIQEEGSAHWPGGSSYGLLGGETGVTVTALKALCLGRPHSKLIPLGEAYLSSCFDGQHWGSTWITGQVVSLLPELARTRKLHWEGAPIQVELADGRRLDLSEQATGVLKLQPGTRTVLHAEGKGLLIHVLESGTAKARLTPKPGAPALSVQRSLYGLKRSDKGYERKPWTGKLKLNEEALLVAEILSDKALNYGLVEVPLPAGLEADPDLESFVLEGEDLSVQARWTRNEVHPDRVAFLIEHLEARQAKRLTLRLRAKLEGRYRLRPLRFSLMGDENLWATSAGGQLEIGEEPEKGDRQVVRTCAGQLVGSTRGTQRAQSDRAVPLVQIGEK